jgi:hypothetical protein
MNRRLSCLSLLGREVLILARSREDLWERPKLLFHIRKSVAMHTDIRLAAVRTNCFLSSRAEKARPGVSSYSRGQGSKISARLAP